jgi:NhaP-type Na+/H+ or K+/H+ antiporter
VEPRDLALLALGVLVFSLGSRRAERGILTAPMSFTLFGLLVSPAVLNLIELPLKNGFVNGLAEITLVLVLFTDASRIDLTRLSRQHTLPIRLLGIGLPLSIALGAAVGIWLFPDIGLWQTAVLGAILAPTDAALGQAVVNNPKVPQRIRQALNVESGLNDGLAFPALLVLLSLAGGAETRSPGEWGLFIAGQLLLGPLAGFTVGFAGAWLVERMSRGDWMNRTFLQISVLSLAVLAYGTAETIGGNGFIAAFTAGLTVGTRAKVLKQPLEDFGEVEGQLLSLVVFLLFGATMLPRALAELGGAEIAYAALSLTVVRMVPVALALIGTGLAPSSVLFIGWFGPRGLASILYLLLITERGNAGTGEALFAAVVCTVFASVMAHGVSASPGDNAYGNLMHRRRMAQGDQPEHETVQPFPTRLPHHAHNEEA